MSYYQSPLNQNEEQQRHEKTRSVLKFVGAIVAAVGMILTVISFVDFFISFGGTEMPRLFFLSFIGLPMFAVGMVLFLFGFHRDIAKFVKNDSMPVAQQAAKEFTPTIVDIADAVRNSDNIVCPYCSAINDANATYCKKCGKTIAKTCPHCGAKVDVDSDFCNKCGKNI